VATIGKGLETYLHRQATETALNHLAEAREQAAKIREQAQSELLQMRQIYEQQLEHSSDQEQRRILAQARLAISHQLALDNERALQEVWQRVEAELRSLIQADVETRRSVLGDLIADAASQLQGGILEFQVSADDLDILTPEFINAVLVQIKSTCSVTDLRLNSKPADIWGGVVVSRLESSQMVDNSLGTRLKLAQTELRNQVFELLNQESISA
jgi:vacuolar-type H+-ATPase subunit E/Vma4